MKLKMFMKRAGIALVMLSSMGCDRPAKEEQGQKRMHVLRFNLQPKPMSLDPRIGGDTRSLVVTRMLFEGLMRLGQDDEPALALADSLEISPDGRVYTFTLRPSVWSNGDPVLAHDFEYAWKWTISPEATSNYGFLFFSIQNAREAKEGKVGLDEVGVKALDDRTLQVTLQHPTPYFLQLVASPVFAPVHQQWEKSHPKWVGSAADYVCNGPFVLTGIIPGSGMQFEKNPRYWDADAVALDAVQISTIDDPYTAHLMYEQGEFDYIGEPLSAIPLECLPQMRSTHVLKTKPVAAVFRYDFNTAEFPFDNPNIRRALSYAIDREMLIKNILKGDEALTTSVLPPNLTLHGEPLFGAAEKENAKTLFEQGLEETGLTVEEFPTVKLMYSMVEGQKALAQAVQQKWQQTFGITIELEGAEFGTYYNKLLSGQYEIAAVTWYSWHHDPIYNLAAFKHKVARMNSVNWENPDYVAHLDASETDVVGRREHLKAAEALIAEEMPAGPVYAPSFRYATRAEGIYISPVGHIDFKWTTIDERA